MPKLRTKVARRGLHDWWKDGNIPRVQSQERKTGETARFVASIKKELVTESRPTFFYDTEISEKFL